MVKNRRQERFEKMGRKPNEGVEKIKKGDCKAKEREKVNANIT